MTRQFKIAVLKKLNEMQGNTETKSVNKMNTFTKRLKLKKKEKKILDMKNSKRE